MTEAIQDAPDPMLTAPEPSVGDIDELIERRLELIEPLMQKIGIPKGTIGSLMTVGSDWEFVIKLAVILESALTEALVSHLHNDGIRGHIQSLTMQGRTGKIPLALKVRLLAESEAGQMRVIADVRNAFAHSPKNIGGSLEIYASGLSDPKPVAAALLGLEPDVARALFKGDLKWFPGSLRYFLWLAGGQALAALASKDLQAEHARTLAMLREQTLQGAQAGSNGLASLFWGRHRGNGLLADAPAINVLGEG